MYKKLTIAELKFLKNLYTVNWPKYVPTFALLEHFIERFEKHPEWQEKVNFLTVNDESLKRGTFLAIYCNYVVNFNSLEPAPYTNLEKLLNNLDFSEEKMLRTIEVHHVGVVEKIIKLQNLEKLFDESSKCLLNDFQLPASMMEKFIEQPPQGFYYDSLKLGDIAQLSVSATYKHPTWYLENVIKYNVTTGLYTNDGKLVAWTATHEQGQQGMTHVEANYRRNKVAVGVLMTQATKVFATGKNIFGHVFDTNDAGMQLFNSIGNMEIIGSHRWLILRKNTSCAMKSQL